jgi:hypothetical protein
MYQAVQKQKDGFLCLHSQGWEDTLAFPSLGLFEAPVAKCNKVQSRCFKKNKAFLWSL